MSDNEIATLTQQMPQALTMLEKLVGNENINLEAMDKLIDLQIKMMNHQAKMDYAAALVRFNSIKQPIKTNRKGKTAGSAQFAYADFPELVKQVSPWLSQCGLSFSHRQDDPTLVDGMVKLIIVHCEVQHVSGHSESVSFPAIPDEKLRGHLSPSQLIQLALTYAKRQTLSLILGIAAHEDKKDDDSQNRDNSRPAQTGDNDPFITFGKYSKKPDGPKKWSELSVDYLKYIVEKGQKPESRERAQSELDRKAGGTENVNQTIVMASEQDIRLIRESAKAKEITVPDILEMFELDSMDKIRQIDTAVILKWIANPEEVPAKLAAF